MMFASPEQSHAHSLKTLEALYEYDDFMASIDTLVDLGCGHGLDLEWWSTRTSRDDNPDPLNIKCMGIDKNIDRVKIRTNSNITYQVGDFETAVHGFKNTLFDVLWCHDTFQYVLDPLGTLARWRNIANDNAMLVLILPQTTSFTQNRSDFIQPNHCYYHHTLVSLIHMLAVTGWDCREGFFYKHSNDPWIHAAVYKSQKEPMDAKLATWYDLADMKLLPESAEISVHKHGFLRQQDLVLPWLDKNLVSYAKH